MVRAMRCRVVEHSGAPLAGVVVSDGATVAVTDSDGRVEFEPDGSPFVWVRRPTGFEATRRFSWVRDVVGEVTFELAHTSQPLPVTFARSPISM